MAYGYGWKRCAWCGDYAEGTAIDDWWDPYYGWISDVFNSCGDWDCGFEFIPFYA